MDQNRKHTNIEKKKNDIILLPITKPVTKPNLKRSDIYQKKIEEYKKNENKSWTPNNTILIYAAKNDKREDLEYLQSEGKLEGAVNTLLKKALLHGHEELGKWFLHIGANLENMSKNVPLLHFAASKGYSDFLKVLLEKHSLDTNAKDENHETALHLAIRNGNPEICRLLLHSGARTDISDRDGLQPLHRAAQVKNIAKMIDLLLEFNADIEAIDEHSKCPLEYAFERSFNKHVAVCHLIKQGAKVGKTFVSQGSFFGKNAVQVGHTLGMTTTILRAVRYRSSEVNKKDLFVLDCVNLTGDIGALVDLLLEDGNILSLCDLNTDDTTKRLLSYVEMTRSHRLYQCMKERGLLVAKTPPDVRKGDNINTLTESLQDSNIMTDDARDTPVLSHEQRLLGEQMMVLHFEAVDEDEFILTRGKGGSPSKLMKDANSAELVVVVSPSKDEQSIQKVVALAAQHQVHRARGVFEKDSLTFKHIQTSDFLADSEFQHGIPSDLQYSVLVSENKTVNLLEKKLKLTRGKSPYDTPVLSHEQRQLGEQMMVLHFEAVDDDEFILSRGKGGSPSKLMKDANSAELVVVVSPSKDEQSIQKVVALAAQHQVHRARGVFEKDSLTFKHIQTSDFLADSEFQHGIPSDLQYSVLVSENKTVNLLEKKLKLTRGKSPYDLHSLHHCVLHNEVDELQNMLHSGKTIDVNVKDEAGWTALNLAILLGEKQMVEMLLDGGAIVTLDMAQYLPACFCGDWDRNAVVELSPLILSVRLNLTQILQLLSEKNSGHPSIDLCIKLSYGLKVESVLLESVCKTAERKHQAIGVARFRPTYTARTSRPIQRVCLGFSDDVSYKEEKGDIHGVQIVVMNKDISPESDWTEDTEMTEDEEVVSKAIIDLWADHLWEQHSNLNAITAGSLVRMKSQEMKPKGHIILHCSHKEYIPLESERFPTELTCEKGAMPVAVLEGEFRLGPIINPLASGSISGIEKAAAGRDEPDQSENVNRSNLTKDGRKYPMKTTEHIPLKIGMNLCQSDSSNESPYEGTLGIFVEMGNNKTGFVTCAHLFYKDKINKGEHPIYFPCPQQLSGDYVIAPLDAFEEEEIRQVEKMDVEDEPVNECCRNVTHNVYWECGKVVRAVFDSALDVGIDAALIEIDPIRVPRDGSFDYIKGTHLRHAGFNWRDPPRFISGKQADSEYLRMLERPIRCMKLGASSGLSVGILTCNGQVKMSDSDPLGIERDSIKKYILKNQFVISEYSKKQFFELGDSGSAVFVMKGGRGHYYPDACLGIAIGFLNNKTFVTPIESVLKTLGSDIAPKLTLKKF
ncbi:uncharacterized protein LOC117322450 isoform X1 [Pecten maximus]|uniref:uncharacterized protein LOC117322450 isoform X1 n=1 Tax=Pecten maximus TaxID=6579 RepID=UPI001458348C|nr:uncharacterized protein LOC117322450 isoform X1 [Pecten maximus]